MTLCSKSKLLNGPVIALNVCITGSVSVPPSFIVVHLNRIEFSFNGIRHQLRIYVIPPLLIHRCELTLVN